MPDLYGSTSTCCKARNVIVLSKSGGYLSQNCEACGRKCDLSFEDIPNLTCPTCVVPIRPGYSKNGVFSATYVRAWNYGYCCSVCGYLVELAALVPPYAERFPDK